MKHVGINTFLLKGNGFSLFSFDSEFADISTVSHVLICYVTRSAL